MMVNPYDAPPPSRLSQGTPRSRWRFLPAGICLAFAAWYTYALVMTVWTYTTLVVENDMVYNGMLLMAASCNAVLILVIIGAMFAARRALRGRWLSAMAILLVGYISVLFVRETVAPFLFNWYLANAQGV